MVNCHITLTTIIGPELGSKTRQKILKKPAPSICAAFIISVGNAAGVGASAALLDINKRKTIIDAVDEVVKIETATESKFQEYFVDAMKFSVSPVKEQKINKVRRRRRVS